MVNHEVTKPIIPRLIFHTFDVRFRCEILEFMDPIATGEYPRSMHELLVDRLPKFTAKESDDLKGSFDFLGLNYYTANYAQDAPHSHADSKVRCTPERNGVPIGEKAGSDWLYVYPQGIWDLLTYTKNKYNNPIVYITENGRDELNIKNQSFWVSLFDFKRISYHHTHLSYVKQAIQEGANVKRYYIWSLMDNLEWNLNGVRVLRPGLKATL